MMEMNGMFKVGDIVAAAPDMWASKNVGKKGVVKAIDIDFIVVEMLEAMPAVGIGVGYEWWLDADNWVKVKAEPLVCKSLL
nr:MAG TPA: hypothetical protein [Caudoviricetes sp.]